AQVAGLVLPAFEAPNWILRALFFILALGLPITIMAAWLYEITPNGLRRHGKAATEQQEPVSGPRVVDSVVILALVFTVILVGIGRDGWLIGMELITAKDVTALLDTRTEPQRVAVFPFAAVNSDLDGRLVAEGVTSELADRLQDAPALSVVGTTSTFEFERRRAASDGAARVFGVEHLVEGSVRRDGDTLTINAQLVQAADRGVLAEHSEEVPPAELDQALDRLASRLFPSNGPRPGNDRRKGFASHPDAVDWLRLRASLARGTAEDVRRAREIAASLADKVPESGEARAAHGIALLLLARLETSDFEERTNRARTLLDQAITLAPESRQVLRWRAQAESLITRWRGRDADFLRVLSDIEHALERFPGDPALLGLRVRHCAAFGDFRCATGHGRDALAVNPLDHELYEVLVESMLVTGRTEESAQLVDQARQHGAPDEFIARLEASVALARGDAGEALRQLDGVDVGNRDAELLRLQLLASVGEFDRARALLDAGDSTAGFLGRAWAAMLDRDFVAAYEEARRQLSADTPEQALLLGQFAVQAERYEDAAELYGRHFTDWLRDSGPLLGQAAWINAPWYALALRDSGRAQDARRLLDRHLTGVLAAESSLEAVRRNLYLAANHAVSGRSEDAVARLDRALASGLHPTWGVLGGLQAISDSRLLGGIANDPKLALAFERADLPTPESVNAR
ncbi:MAG: hypothetical protein LC637_11210, partial [Xanthomonadaceae bacterium]|nr:hypothetical protein [Xanthomonadaceae bacterium]